ncbi:hypothetical protein C8R48DRAFT_782409 [Suillus tomentosus]|nr:hypothetical protein C8R48DRAFT_782409 [Suillus tomentosus]
MADADDDDEDTDLDGYSDAEDTLYKIRRASTKILTAVITTRPERPTSLYKEVSRLAPATQVSEDSTLTLQAGFQLLHALLPVISDINFGPSPYLSLLHRIVSHDAWSQNPQSHPTHQHFVQHTAFAS